MQERERQVRFREEIVPLKKDFGFSGWRVSFPVRSFVGRRRRRTSSSSSPWSRAEERKERRHHRSSSRRGGVVLIYAKTKQIFDFSIPKRETTKKKKRNEKHKNRITHVEYCQQRVFFFFSFLVVVVSSGGIDARDDIYILLLLLLLLVCSSVSSIYFSETNGHSFYISKGKEEGRNESRFAFAFFEAKMFFFF